MKRNKQIHPPSDMFVHSNATQSIVTAKLHATQNGIAPSKPQINIQQHQNKPLLLHLIPSLLLHLPNRPSLSRLLFLALPLNLLCHEILISLQRLLNMNLELDNIVQHSLQLGVQFFSQSR